MPTEETMLDVIVAINDLDINGKLGGETNPQILFAVRKSRVEGEKFDPTKALEVFNDIVTRDSNM